MGEDGFVDMSLIHVSVSVAINFVHSSRAADQVYQAFGEMKRFVYCLLQRIKKTSALPLGEQWEKYVVPNQSRFTAIDEKDFLAGTRVMAALDKVGSQYLRTEFRRDSRRFFEEFVNCVSSTFASRSAIGQGLSSFCPALLVGGDVVALFQFFNKLLDELLEKGWTRGSEIEACRAEHQFFVREQWQLERSSTRSRPDLGEVLSFCSAQAGFRARRHLYKVRIVSNKVFCFGPYEFCCPLYELLLFQAVQLTPRAISGPATHGVRFIIRFDRVAIKEKEVRDVLFCVQDSVRSPHVTQRSFFRESGLTMLSESVATADSISSSPVYAPWSVVESACANQVMTDLCACWERVVLRRRSTKDTSQLWYHGGFPRSETASRPGVIISDVVEDGRVEYVPVTPTALGPPGPSKILSSSSKWKIKISRSPLKLPRRFEASSLPACPQRRSLVEDPSFASVLATPAFRGKSHRSGRDRRAGPVFQMGFHRDNFL